MALVPVVRQSYIDDGYYWPTRYVTPTVRSRLYDYDYNYNVSYAAPRTRILRSSYRPYRDSVYARDSVCARDPIYARDPVYVRDTVYDRFDRYDRYDRYDRAYTPVCRDLTYRSPYSSRYAGVSRRYGARCATSACDPYYYGPLSSRYVD